MKSFFKKIIVKILFWQSKRVLARYKPKVIAITGSVGKTSTKDAIYTVLSHFYSVRKSYKSFNSEIGLPLTIIGCKNGWNNPLVWIENILKGFWLLAWKHKYPKYLVLEVGAGKPGDIKNVAYWLKADIVVYTRLPDVPVHVEFFPSTEKLIEEKSHLGLGMKSDGLLMLNHDDENVLALHHRIKRKFVSFGFDESATYQSLYVGIDMDSDPGMHFKFKYEGNVLPVKMHHIIGKHHIYASTVALAIAHELHCDMLKAVQAVAEYKTPAGRLTLIQGMNDSTIIDDSYNSSPTALDGALETLNHLKGKRKIAILGDMLELGKMTDTAHRQAGEHASRIAEILILVGPRSKFIAEGAENAGFKKENIYIFDSSITAGKFANGIVEKGDLVLVKGSQGMRLERAIKMIMADPSEAPKLLCRQEKEWQKR